jgi:hypothetical protein
MNWHREIPDDSLTMCDVDSLEYCWRCNRPLALIETARDVGQVFKKTAPMVVLSRLAKVPSVLTLYERGCKAFRFQPLRPRGAMSHKISPSDYVAFLRGLREPHARVCRGRDGQ